MRRRLLPAHLLSGTPNRLQCLAVLSATAWGVHGLRLNSHQIMRRTDLLRGHIAARFSSTLPATPCFAPARTTPALNTYGWSGSRGRTYKCHVTVLESRGGEELQADAVGVVEDSVVGEEDSATDSVAESSAVTVEERPWLGNGADPMAEARKNLPSSLAEVAGVGGGAKGKGVPMEEVWLNGPFKASLPPGPVDVLYVDDDIVVVNKPSGLLCVPGRVEKDSLATRVALQLGHYRVDRMIVHRLDMATSGAVIMARSDAALKDLNRQFRNRDVRKRYIAMVHGVVAADEGEVDLPLCRNTGCPPLHMVNLEHGKPSLTQWRVMERAADRTRVELIPVSGRSHQLRLHMDAIGHPILGDHFYGTKESLDLAGRCLLHAHTLCLRHPITGERTMFTAPCDF